ncbi:hypothetical protein [Leptospira stimsonii]|uniref:DUF481 domain-containing protein n=1 Tax=Leptospira stimsonii TaxID=2202203 RepID=A0A396Z1F8_9LEPT|nr:hypothetical protein [Leptospira stimsonii]RHX86980.1 hypothetical protein DLM75_18550 [Leptospira stimsonii]
MNAKRNFLLILFLFSQNIFGENLFFNSPEPKNRLAVALQGQEQESLEAKKDVVTGILQAEKTIGTSVSLFAALPYTRLNESGEKKREHLNQQQIGLKLFFSLYDFGIIGGSNYSFATGKERLEIGSEKFGNIEFYGGLFYKSRAWAIFSVARWNSQLTPHLRERDGEQFEKTWYFDFWLSYTYHSLESILEVTRKVQYDPQLENLYSTIVAPGFLVHLEMMTFGISAPITVSRSYVPDGTLAHPETTFQRNDFDRSILLKAFKYF